MNGNIFKKKLHELKQKIVMVKSHIVSLLPKGGMGELSVNITDSYL